MKKLLLLTLLYSLSQVHLNAQHHFPKDSAEWKVWHLYNAVPYSSYLTVHNLFGDTTLLGTNWKAVSPGFFSGWDSYIREVDSTQKIYILYAFDDTVSSRLLYDFSKSVGDTIAIVNERDSPHVYYSPVSVNWIVIGEGLDSIGFQQRRYLDVKREGWNYYDRWYEGIGSVHGLFAPTDEPSGWFEHNFQMVCFTDKGSGVQYEPFPSNKYNCNTPAHVFDVAELNLGEKGIGVYPNPFIDNVSFENLSPEPLEFVLYSADGNIVKEGSLNSFEKQTLNTQNVKSGLYILVSENDGQVSTRKIICGGNLRGN